MFQLDPVTDVLVCLALGVATFAIGAAGLLSRRLRLRASGAVARLALGAVVGTALVVKGSWVLIPLVLLGTVLGIVCLARMPRFQIRSPLVAPACLACIGVGLLFWQDYSLDRQLEQDVQVTDDLLEGAGPPPLVPMDSTLALTDENGPITLLCPGPHSDHTADFEAAYIRSFRLVRQVIQTAQADDTHNCHGWVFTGGKAWVGGASVPKILGENRYQRVSAPVAGDLVIFRDPAGQVSHTAVVRGVPDGGPVLLESKWGRMGRYIHTLDKHAYSASTYAFYRSPRAGHRLRLLEYQGGAASKPESRKVRTCRSPALEFVVRGLAWALLSDSAEVLPMRI